ncbi:MAG TPA: hypothetical protein PK760_06830, partial [Flavobacteriales bacterium]|nr:hypothetical protein [Flavobacteriales bacterium]
MISSPLMRSAIIIAALAASFTSNAQGTSKEGYTLEWDKTITVVPDSMSVGKRTMAAWTISVFEADASEALDMWKAEMKPISQGVSGSRPMKAVGALVPGIGSGIVAFASSTTEKKPKHARLTVTFAMNDSTPMASNAGQEAYVRALAVKFNRAVVQKQIAGYEKMLGKAGDKLSGTQDDVSKSRSNIAKSTSKLKKVEAQRGKVQGDIARQQGDVAGLEKKFALT